MGFELGIFLQGDPWTHRPFRAYASNKALTVSVLGLLARTKTE
jgi:hypothetical protein